MSGSNDTAAPVENFGAAPRPPERDARRAIGRGFLRRCPNCGEGHLFDGYLKVRPACEVCGEAFHHHRADDFPPYLVIFIVGHIVVPLLLVVEKAWHPDLVVLLLTFLPLTAILCLLLLPPVKGAVIGLQWGNRMHGFDPAAHDPADPAPVAGTSP